MNTILASFPCKPTKYRQTLKRRVNTYFGNMTRVIALYCAAEGRDALYTTGVRFTFRLAGDEIVFELDFDDTWTHEKCDKLLQYIKSIKKIQRAHLTTAPEPDTMPA